MHARSLLVLSHRQQLLAKKLYAKMESRTLFPKMLKLENNFQSSAIFRTAVCFRRARLSSKKGKIVNLQAVIARVRGNDAHSCARTHTHTQLFSFKFVTEFADVSPFGVFPASTLMYCVSLIVGQLLIPPLPANRPWSGLAMTLQNQEETKLLSVVETVSGHFHSAVF